MKTFILPLVIFFSLLSCIEETPQPVDLSDQRKRCDPADRIGCLCKDGSKNSSTDITSCDKFGGFDRYICKWE